MITEQIIYPKMQPMKKPMVTPHKKLLIDYLFLAIKFFAMLNAD
jgi:hypothetical protein